MTARVIVIGAGVAGVAAAWEAAKQGAQVTVLRAAPGSSALSSGGVHGALAKTEARVRPLPLAGSEPPSFFPDSGQAREPDPDVVAFCDALGLWTLTSGGCRVATQSGACNEATGCDRAILDLETVRGRTVGVVDGGPRSWDAPGLAASLSDTEWAKETNTRFVPVPVEATRHDAEASFPTVDFAELHDDPDRAGWLAARLADALSTAKATASESLEAWLVGPWLGLLPGTLVQLRELVGIPIGESASMPGETAGRRFELRSEQLLSDVGASAEVVRVRTVRQTRTGVEILTRDGAEVATRRADAVVIATGGIAAGGIRMVTAAEAARAAPSFRLGLELEGEGEPIPRHPDLVLGGQPVGPASSVFGSDMLELGLGALERVGLSLDHDTARVAGFARVFAAGDVAAPGCGTALSAASEGLIAGRSACLASRPV